MYWWSDVLKKWHCSLLGETMKYYLWINVDVCWPSCINETKCADDPLFFLPLDKLSGTVGGSYLWIPEHSMQSSTPKLMEAQQGAVWLQSQQISLPGRLCTLWRRLSPPPRAPLSALSPLSLGSLAESMLLVEGDAVRSKRCTDKWLG